MTPCGRRHACGEQGSGLLLVVLLGGLISALGLGLAALSATERAMTGNYQTGVQLLYAAESLARRMIGELSNAALWSAALAGSGASTFRDPSDRPVTRWGEVLDLAAMTAAARAGGGAGGPQWQPYASGHFDELNGLTAATPAYVIGWVADGGPATDILLLRAEARGMGGLSRGVHVVLRNVLPAASGEPTTPLLVYPPGVHVVSWREVR